MMRAFLAAACAVMFCAGTAWAEEVTIRVEDRTYPIKPTKRAKPKWPAIKKFEGKTEYTTKAVILENDQIVVTVLPEFGGRITRAELKLAGGKREDIFWVNDEIVDDISWSMGGCRISFPFWEHGRHFDETAGWTSVKNKDGSITLALDMRFEQFNEKIETTRYGRATNLRLAQFITLAPGQKGFSWRTVVENPMPVPCGFKVWALLRQPNTRGTQIVLPTKAVTNHGADKLEEWDQNTVVDTLNVSKFAVGMKHGFSGWYMPGRDLNVIVQRDAATVPGAKMVLYPANDAGRGYIETWHGNHEVFEETGRMLPAFGAYEMALTVRAEKGLGAKAAWVTEKGEMQKERPAGFDFGPMPEKEFAAVQARVKGTMAGGQGLYAEGMDLVTETQMNLVRYADTAAKVMAEGKDKFEILDAARRYWRVRGADEKLLTALGREEVKDDAHAVLLRWLAELEKDPTYNGIETHRAALNTPGGRFLAVLEFLRNGKRDEADDHATKLALTQAAAAFVRGRDDPAYQLMQPGATKSNSLVQLLRIVAARAGKEEMAKQLLETLIARDPAFIEARLLRGDADRTLLEGNEAGEKVARESLKALQEGRWRGIMRPRD